MRTRPASRQLVLLCALAFASFWPHAAARAQDRPFYEAAKIDAVAKLVVARLKEAGERETRWATDRDFRGNMSASIYDLAKKLFPESGYERWKPTVLNGAPFTDFRAEGRLVFAPALKRYDAVPVRRDGTRCRLEPTGLIEVSGAFVLLESPATVDGTKGYKHAGVVNFGLVRSADRGLAEDLATGPEDRRQFLEQLAAGSAEDKKSKVAREWMGNHKAARYWLIERGSPDPAKFGQPATDEKAAVAFVTADGRWTISLSVAFGFADARADKFVRANVKPLTDLAKEIEALLVGSSEPPRTPVVFIPGILGSTLKKGNAVLWPRLPTVEMSEALSLVDKKKPDEKDREPEPVLDVPNMDCRGVAAGEVLQRGDYNVTQFTEPPFNKLNYTDDFNFYGKFLALLRSQMPGKGKDVHEFPYDWRLSAVAHLKTLDDKIEEVLRTGDATQVHLVGHSTGGLIARAYVISSPQRAARVKSIITVGTPYGGAPKAFRAITEGHDFDSGALANYLRTLQWLEYNTPGVYQLLPADSFITESGKPLPYDDCFELQFPEPMKESTRVTMRKDLLRHAREFFQAYGRGAQAGHALPPTHTIIGVGLPTLNRYELVPEKEFLLRYPHKRRDWGMMEVKDAFFQDRPFALSLVRNGNNVICDPYFGDGDGTVPVERAKLPSAAGVYEVDQAEHSELLRNADVQKLIVGILKDGKATKETPPRRTHTQCAWRCDGYLTLLDDRGRSLGFDANGMVLREIPGGGHLVTRGGDFLLLNRGDMPVRAVATGLRDGSATLEVKLIRDGQVAGEFVYANIPMSADTVAEVTFTPDALSGSIPDLKITKSGVTTAHPATVTTAPAPTVAPSAPNEPNGAKVKRPVRSARSIVVGAVLLFVVLLAVGGIAWVLFRHRRNANAVTPATKKS